MSGEPVRRRDILRTASVGALCTVGVSSGATAAKRDQSIVETEYRDNASIVTTAFGQSAKLAADDGDAEDQFGSRVAVSDDGTTAVVGARADEDPNGGGAGSAYVFSESDGTWSQQAKLIPEDGDAGDSFGFSVAVSGDGTTAVVGARDDGDPNGDFAGSAYVFSGADGSWTQQAKLAAEDGDSNDQFGSAVALSGAGDTAVVGAFGDDRSLGFGTGSAYVFRRSGGTWTQQAKLTAADGDRQDAFGGAIAVSNDGSTAVVGARADEDPNGDGAGSAYVFTGSDGSWAQQAKLAPEDGDDGDQFGISVATSGDGSTAVVGAREDEDPNGNSAGSVYVFGRSDGTWAEQTKLAASEPNRLDNFGTSVAVSNDGATAIVGALRSQQVWVFSDTAEGWSQQEILEANDSDGDDDFGESVALSGNGATTVVGAPGDEDPNGDGAGSAYVFDDSGGETTTETPSDESTPGSEPTTDASDSETSSTTDDEQNADTPDGDGSDEPSNGDDGTDTSSGSGPGFGAVTALTALSAAAYRRLRSTEEQ